MSRLGVGFAVALCVSIVGCGGEEKKKPGADSEWLVRVLNAEINEIESTTGDAWDVPGGLPDPSVCIGPAASTCTVTINDTLQPIWDETLSGTLIYSDMDAVDISAWDEDVSDFELIASGIVDLQPSEAGKAKTFHFAADDVVDLAVRVEPN